MGKYIIILFCTALSCGLPELATSNDSPMMQTTELKVIYPNNLVVRGGNVLYPADVIEAPDVDWVPERDTLYTLTLASNTALHWFIGNIPGNTFYKGQTIVYYYLGSSTLEGTGTQRYTFSLYRQSGTINYNEERTRYSTVESRKQFALNFVQKHNLELAAENYFETSYDGNTHFPRQQVENRDRDCPNVKKNHYGAECRCVLVEQQISKK